MSKCFPSNALGNDARTGIIASATAMATGEIVGKTLNLQAEIEKVLEVLQAGTETVLEVHIAPVWTCWQLASDPGFQR